MKPFREANALLDQPLALRAQACEDGYLFFRQGVPADALQQVRRAILVVCERHGWLQEGSPVAQGIANLDRITIEGQPAFMQVYDEVQRLECFHALAHHPCLLELFGALFGETVLVHPRNIARLIFPQNTLHTTPAHQDYIHIQGTEETWTAWVPLGDCPRTLGSLEVLPGSHRLGLLPVHAAYGAGGAGVETDSLGLEWHGGDFACGDVLVFHSLCIHRATPNMTTDRLRLSVDYRYQAASQPVVEGSLLPHHQRLTWEQIYAGWSNSALQYYWKTLPLRIVPFNAEVYAPLRS